MNYESLVANFLSPKRGLLLEALGCVLGRVPDPSEIEEELSKLGKRDNKAGRVAWESLAARGFIPMDWIDNSTRCFSQMAKPFNPSSARLAALLASNVPGVLAVEELAREAVTRAAWWGPTTYSEPQQNFVARPERMLWVNQGRDSYLLWNIKMAFTALFAANGLDGPGRVELGKQHASFIKEQLGFPQLINRPFLERVSKTPKLASKFGAGLSTDLRAYVQWEFAAARKWKITEEALTRYAPGWRKNFLPSNVLGRSLDEFPNPYVPLLQIWDLGYALLWVGEEVTALLVA